MTAAAYVPPTPDEVRALLAALNLTGGQAADLCGLSGDRAIRKYTGGAAPRAMAFATLYTLISRARGIAITPADWRGQVFGGKVQEGGAGSTAAYPR